MTFSRILERQAGNAQIIKQTGWAHLSHLVSGRFHWLCEDEKFARKSCRTTGNKESSSAYCPACHWNLTGISYLFFEAPRKLKISNRRIKNHQRFSATITGTPLCQCDCPFK
jgi:hypothetical protein